MTRPSPKSNHHRRCCIAVVVASCAASSIFFQPNAINAYSFVSSRQRRHLQYSKCYLDTSLTLYTPGGRQTTISSASQLVMKRPNRRRRSNDNTQEILQQPAQDLPSNLKRHVVAKRPTLGHIVPKNSKTRQYKPDDQVSGGSNTSQLRPQGQSRDTLRYNNPSNLKILGGSVRGRKLESPNVYLRPMMGKVKEAVYSTFTTFGLYEDNIVGGSGSSSIGSSCNTRHLDIFSGSGSVGLESLSRGARHCTFVDMSSDCCGACERNIERCGFDGWNEGGIGTGIPDEGEPVSRVVCADAFRALKQPETLGIPIDCKYDIVTLCPPYEEIVYADLLDAVANSVLVGEDTIIMVEYPVELGCLPHVIGREDGGVLVGVRNRRYGRTVSLKECSFHI